MEKIAFATLILPGKPVDQALLLVDSLQQFGGKRADTPVWAFVPETHNAFSQEEKGLLADCQVEVVPFTIDEKLLKFPFAAKVIAAAAAEIKATNAVELLAFFDRDTLFLQEPVELLLPPSISLGYRPVHHQLIGSTWGQPVDDFWAVIYSRYNIPSDHLFPMTTHTGEEIYPYFNCGVYIVRPEHGLLKRWRDDFLNLHQDPVMQGYYQQDDKYAVFIHQVVFTGVMLAELRREEMFELSPAYNYPLHLHQDVPAEQRPSSIWDLLSARYESIFWEDNWQSHPLVDEKLVEWLFGKRLLD